MTFLVCHIVNLQEWPDKGPLSGAENHLLDLMRGQARAGIDVELLALIQRDGPQLRQIFHDIRNDGVRVTAIDIDLHPEKITLFKQIYDACIQRRDHIIHVHLSIASFYGRLAAHLAGCKAIVESWHNDDPADARGVQRVKWRLLDFITDAAIAITDNVKKFLIEKIGLNGERIYMIRYGISPPKTVISREQARVALGIPTNAFCIGFVGRLTYQKNIPLLLEATKDLPVTVCLIGTGEDETELKKIAGPNVIFSGFRANAADDMNAFDLFVLPSRWEGLGLVLLEAMVRHIPVAGSRNGAIPEILDDGKRGFLFSTADEIKTYIQQAQINPQILQDKARIAFNDVTSQFTIDAMVRQTTLVYERALSVASKRLKIFRT